MNNKEIKTHDVKRIQQILYEGGGSIKIVGNRTTPRKMLAAANFWGSRVYRLPETVELFSGEVLGREPFDCVILIDDPEGVFSGFYLAETHKTRLTG